jgi:muramoyltetrapeptide carboxypeptidase
LDTAPAVAPAAVPVRRPAALGPGDVVALVSPAGPVPRARVDLGVELLSSWGLVPEVAPHALDRGGERLGYLAGADADRLGDLNAAFADPRVRAVFCTRGGYGGLRIVDGLDLEPLREDPKPLVGFSDVTTLQLALWAKLRLVSVHGPVAAWNPARLGPVAAEALRSAVMTTGPVVVARDPAEPTAAIAVPGVAHGTLIAANLALLVACLGSADFPDLTGAIVLLEDVTEEPYRLDRLLTQLRRAGLGRAAGIALGQFTECGPAADVVTVLADRLTDLGIPVLGGLPVGHGQDQRTVPFGVPAVLDVAAGTLTAEAAVTAA